MVTEPLRTDRLTLTPVAAADAGEMVLVLSSQELYEFTGGSPPSVPELESRYHSQVVGPTSGDEVWHNWIVRLGGEAVGFVQATVTDESADVAWVVGLKWQGQGIAREAASAMCDWLAADGVEKLVAHIHPDHVASQRVAAALGLIPTDKIDDEGEVVWFLETQCLGETT